ncbi:hypothetical protein HFRIS_006403 [Herbaspirillum frisingense GSF30]|uniref:Uncharacterized protein n=1 Tax=Herbaspirillum frisingense GSF30 TaxID=864073 RepID=A0AAI9IGD3_9BURK|nr:hypothetical protein [Herbaspirillum frisingense]EOA05702.1 hypothetical protein HFRIS_006403 [Herbaspirillum frisingense GSF30]
MMITAAQASALVASKPNSFAPPTPSKPDNNPVEESAKVAISSEAVQKAAESEAQSNEVESAYRLTGPATLLSSIAPVAYQMPEALINEMKVRASEEATRNAINSQYANAHQYQTVGQVLVNGKLFAEVNDAGGYGSIQNSIPGLSDAPLNPQDRLKEIAQAVKEKGNVEIRYSDFVPGLGGQGGSAAPESMLPAFTARNIHEIFAEAIGEAKRLRSASLPQSE